MARSEAEIQRRYLLLIGLAGGGFLLVLFFMAAQAVVRDDGASRAAPAVAAESVPEPAPPLTREQAFVGGWLPYYRFDDGFASFAENTDVFRDVSLFGYLIDRSGQLVTKVTPQQQAQFLQTAQAAGVTTFATVFDESGRGTMARILANPATRASHEDSLVALVVDNGFDGLDVDYENFAFVDGTASWSATRPLWVAFIAELSAKLRANGKLLSVATPTIFSSEYNNRSGYWVYDWAGIAPDVDQVRIMAYDYSTDRPGPLAPNDWTTRSLDYALTVLSPQQVNLGVPTYARSWDVATRGACLGGKGTRGVDADIALARAATERAEVVFDETVGESSFEYTESQGFCDITRFVTVSDARSVAGKAELARARGVPIQLWVLGAEDPAQWDALRRVGAQ